MLIAPLNSILLAITYILFAAVALEFAVGFAFGHAAGAGDLLEGVFFSEALRFHQGADLGGDAGGRGVAGGRGGGGDEEQDELAAHGGAGGECGAYFGDWAAQELLVKLGQLARDDDVLREAEDGFDVGERGENAVRGFVEDLDLNRRSLDCGRVAAFARDDNLL